MNHLLARRQVLYLGLDVKRLCDLLRERKD